MSNATGIKVLIGCALFMAAVCVVGSFVAEVPGSNVNAVASSMSEPGSPSKRSEEG